MKIKIIGHFLLIIITFISLEANAQRSYKGAKRSLILPTYEYLTINKKYDNAMRTKYHIGANIGANISVFQPALVWQTTFSYAPKNFLIMGYYQKDASEQKIKSSEITKLNAQNEICAKIAINIEDKIVRKNITPTVGIDVISTDTIINGRSYTAFYEYYTIYATEKRITSGFLISLMYGNSNLLYDSAKADMTKKAPVSFEKGTNYSGAYFLPYSTTTLGIGYSTAYYTGYRVNFKLEDLKRIKVHNNIFFIQTYELLFAPTYQISDSIYFKNVVDESWQSLKVKNVQKSPLGFRITLTTNLLGKTARKPGLYQTVDAGIRPGIYYKRNFQADDDSKFANSNFVKSIATQPWYIKYNIGLAL